MKLTFHTAYKSVKALPEITLPDFVVLTGVNGSGKTHLLEAIDNGSIQIDDIAITQPKPIRLFNWANLIPQDSGTFAPSQFGQERFSLWNELAQYIGEYRPQIVEVLRQFGNSKLINTPAHKLVRMTEEDFVAVGIDPVQVREVLQSIQNVVPLATQNVVSRFQQSDPNRQRLIKHLQETTSIPLIGFEEDDFFQYYPMSWAPVDMFQQSFSRLFAQYQKLWLDNQLKEFWNSKGENVVFLLNEELRQFKSEVQQVLMAEDKVLRKAFDSQEIFSVDG